LRTVPLPEIFGQKMINQSAGAREFRGGGLA